jgi:N-acetylglutamate synthase-like GNAT family acetyltransferase
VPVSYKKRPSLPTDKVFQLFEAADFPGPTGKFAPAQVAQMITHANLIMTAWNENKLVGVSLSTSNFVSVCFLVALVIHPDYQAKGIGKELVRLTRQEGGDQGVSFVTISTPNATDFYESVGMERCLNGFIVPRER